MAQAKEKSGQGSTDVSPLVYWMAVGLVLTGLLNVTPAIPGWDDLWKTVTGFSQFKIRRFSTEWLYPIVFVWMMLIVAMKHSIWRSWKDRSTLHRRFGLFLDIALVTAGVAISITYPVSYTHLTLPTKA